MTETGAPPREMRLSASRSGAAMLFLGSGAMAIVLLIQALHAAGWAVYAGLVFFSLGAGMGLVRFTWPPPEITLGAESFSFRQYGQVKTYRWSQVSAFRVWTVRTHLTKLKMICFDPDQPPAGKWAKRFARFAGNAMALPQEDFGMSEDDICALMNAFRDRALAEGGEA